MKIKELKDIVAYLEEDGLNLLQGSAEKAITFAKEELGFSDEALYKIVTPSGMTLAEEWQQRWSSYTNLINWIKLNCENDYQGKYYASYHPIFGWRKKEKETV